MVDDPTELLQRHQHLLLMAKQLVAAGHPMRIVDSERAGMRCHACKCVKDGWYHDCDWVTDRLGVMETVEICGVCAREADLLW